MINTYIALDIETTGFHPEKDNIIEIGALKYVEGIEVERFETFVNPNRPIPDKIIEITGITDEMVANAPYIQDVVKEFYEFVENYPILGHNVIFDYSFLKKALAENGFEFEREGIDTLKMARYILPHLSSKKLEYLCEYFEIKNVHHRALADAYSASEVYRKLLDLTMREVRLEQLNYKVPKSSPITNRQKEYLNSLIVRYKIDFTLDIQTLTKSEASREIDKIISCFGIQR